MREGRCLCGAVRFTADGPPKWTGYCHCRSCRRHTGAPVSAYAGFEAAKVRFTGVLLRLIAGRAARFLRALRLDLTYEGDAGRAKSTSMSARSTIPGRWRRPGTPSPTSGCRG